MKIKRIAPVLLLSMAFVACNNQANQVPTDNQTELVEEEQKSSQVEENEEVVDDEENEDTATGEVDEEGIIYTSIYPIYNLTKQIAGDKFEVRNFSSLTTESHGWEPSAKDMAELSEASLMFINGAGMEEWEDSVKNSIDLELVDTSVGVDLLETGHGHDHEHENEDHDHAQEGEDHDDEYEDEDHDHGMYDPHTWLSPVAAKAQAKVIADKLSEIDPANSEYYFKNYDKIASDLDEIIKEFQEKFETANHKNFLVNHKAYSYLAHDFGLNQLALTDITSTGDEGARDVKNMIDTANNLGISTVFYEKGTEGKSAKIIADEIGANIEPLNTMEFATDDELANNTTYQQLIRENLESLYLSMIN